MEGTKRLVIVRLEGKEYIGELDGDLLQIVGVNREHTPAHLMLLSCVHIPIGCPVTDVPHSRLFSNEFCLAPPPGFASIPYLNTLRRTFTLLVLSHVNVKAVIGRYQSFPL